MRRKFSVLLVACLWLSLALAALPVSPARAMTVQVTTLVDENDGCGVGDCSLREAIAAASSGDTIRFAVSGTITLGSQLSINKNLSVDGASQITLDGGGATRLMAVTAGTVTLSGLTFTNGNGSGADGGALYIAGATVTIIHSTFSNNTTLGDGGAIRSYNGSNLTINYSTISNNSAGVAGGGISSYFASTLNINSSTLSNNTAGTLGGGLYLFITGGACTDTPPAYIRSSTFSGNTVTNNGGGAMQVYGLVEITHSTLTGNSAPSGSGLRALNSAGHCVRVGHSIIAGNSGAVGDVVTQSGTPVRYYSLGYNLIGTAGSNVDFAQEFNQTGDVTAVADPGLGALADNGGPTPTHRPSGSSLALDSGAAGCGVSVDQRGAARPYNTNCEKGAVEVRPIVSQGNCAGSDMAGAYPFVFGGSTITLDVGTANGLKCVSAEEMSSNHLLATTSGSSAGLDTGNWWHLQGNIDSGFDVNLTLPYAGANAASRVCRFPGGLGGSGWDCGPLDGTGTSHVAGTTVTRSGLSGFSDWAVGDTVGPTSLGLSAYAARAGEAFAPWLLLAGVLGVGALALRSRRP